MVVSPGDGWWWDSAGGAAGQFIDPSRPSPFLLVLAPLSSPVSFSHTFDGGHTSGDIDWLPECSFLRHRVNRWWFKTDARYCEVGAGTPVEVTRWQSSVLSDYRWRLSRQFSPLVHSIHVWFHEFALADRAVHPSG